MDRLKQLACDAIEREAERLNEISQEIWKLKELGFEEHKSHTILTQFLEDQGFRVEKNYKLDTAFVARFGSLNNPKGEGRLPHVAFLCEYDALPELGHACGHNLIAELGLAAAIGVKAALEEAPIGQVSVIGTPAEEGGGGKIELINAGAFNDVDVAMMAHPAPFSDVRPEFASSKRFGVLYSGKASHAAGFPWEGVNALDGAVLAYMNIAALRQHLKPAWRVHKIITKGGTKTNVIPEEAELMIQVRAPHDHELLDLEKKVKRCCSASADATGCEVSFHPSPKPYSSLVTNETLACLYEQNAALPGLEDTIPKKVPLVLGSTDMGNLSLVVPSLHPCYDINTMAANHTSEFAEASASPLAQSPTLRQGKLLGMIAVDLFQKPALLTCVKADFEKQIGKV